MPQFSQHACRLLITVILTITTPTVLAIQPTTLNHIKHKIDSINTALDQAQHNRIQLVKQLKINEVNTSQLSQALTKTIAAMQQQQQKSNQLNQQLQREQTKIQQQQEVLKKYLQTAYRLGPQPLLKILLTDPNSYQLSRMLSYYHYLTQQQVNVLHDLQLAIKTLKITQQQLQQSYQALKQLKQQQLAQQIKYRRNSTIRQTLIKKINQKITSQHQQLAILQNNKRILDKTVTTVERTPLKTSPSSHFGALKGQLAWPTKGKIELLFGTKIQQSELTWGGILINAPAGQPVYAVAPGQVVFAKWLPGYGLLLIINHGSGYMTLYGRNQAIYKKMGAYIQAGDLIATVGHTGGYQQAALYFAIRRYAKPLNPNKWCHFKTA